MTAGFFSYSNKFKGKNDQIVYLEDLTKLLVLLYCSRFSSGVVMMMLRGYVVCF